MYETFYGFREKPFNLTPDPKFLYLSAEHNEAFAHLAYGLDQRGGFMVVTGEVGTGKTTLCRYFLDRLDESNLSAFVLYPALGTTELLRAINRDLGIPCDGPSDKALIDVLHQFLLKSRREGKNIVLVIDEAQNLSRDVLEQVRLVSNLETDTEKLIQIVLIGQSELNDVLAQNDLRQLAQRVTARYHLEPLGRREMTQYIRHRLAIAGGIGRVDFTPGALRLIHRFSKGVPRLINLVCDRALLAGYVLEKHEIGARLVRRAVAELKPAPSSSGAWSRRLAFGSMSLVVLSGLVVGGASLARVGDPPTSLRPASLLSKLRAQLTASPDGPKEQAAETFRLRLVTLSPEGSKRAASAVLLDRWGVPVAGGASGIAALEDPRAIAEGASLRYEELETSLAQLRALNLPAVLELTRPAGGPDRDDTVFVALTELDDETAVLHFSPGDTARVPLRALLEVWRGRARVFWRDFEDLSSADDPRRLAWTRHRLRALGLLPLEEAAPAPEGAAERLQDAVKALQRRVLLEPTGEVSDETRMALYSLAGGYRMPRLYEP